MSLSNTIREILRKEVRVIFRHHDHICEPSKLEIDTATQKIMAEFEKACNEVIGNSVQVFANPDWTAGEMIARNKLRQEQRERLKTQLGSKAGKEE